MGQEHELVFPRPTLQQGLVEQLPVEVGFELESDGRQQGENQGLDQGTGKFCYLSEFIGIHILLVIFVGKLVSIYAFNNQKSNLGRKFI